MNITKVLRTSDFDYYGNGRVSMIMDGKVPVVLQTYFKFGKQYISVSARGREIFDALVKLDAPGGTYEPNGKAFKVATLCVEIVNGQGDDFANHMPKRAYYDEVPAMFEQHPGVDALANIIGA